MKYKCFKTECPVCVNSGSLQLFINKSNRITYSRVRHYQGKGKYTYCKIEKADLDLLQSQGLKLPSVLDQGQCGQGEKFELHNPQLRSLNSSFSTNKLLAGSSARIEHHPPKPSNNIDPAINWPEYRRFLL